MWHTQYASFKTGNRWIQKLMQTHDLNEILGNQAIDHSEQTLIIRCTGHEKDNHCSVGSYGRKLLSIAVLKGKKEPANIWAGILAQTKANGSSSLQLIVGFGRIKLMKWYWL